MDQSISKIPKRLHYCWFGGNPLPEKYQNYISGWRSKMPDYEIVEWNESNSPIHFPYLQKALENKKWANMANFTRLYALYHQGGIYMDTDIEVLLPFDDLLHHDAFLGFEDIHIRWAGCINNAVFGAIPKHPLVYEMMSRLPEQFDGTEEAHLSSPNFTTALLKEKGLKSYGFQEIAGVTLYPIAFFYPFSWHQTFTPECITPETHTIHWFEQTWLAEQKKVKKSGFLYQLGYNIRKWWN